MRLIRNWNIYVTLGGLLIFIILCGVGFILLRLIPKDLAVEANDQTLLLIPVATFTPTSTVDVNQLKTTPSATPENISGIQVGQYVKINGTDGAGLRIRVEPGLSSNIGFLGMDDELFLVQDGPVHMDDYVWWFLAAPYDQTRSGWAAADFLLPVE